MDADNRGRDRAHDQLALGADVEQAGAEGEGHRDAGHDQWRQEDERVGELQHRGLAPEAEEAEPATEQGLVGEEGVAAGDPHDDGPGHKGQQDRTKRDRQRPAGPPDPWWEWRRTWPGASLNCCGHLAASL